MRPVNAPVGRNSAADVSVVIPTYNRAHWLGELLDCVLGQTQPPREVIVVDDGSSDSTQQLCESYGDRVRYVWQPNAGVSSARNRGIAMARGSWIAFADSDDLWEPNKLEVQLAALAAVPAARWALCDCTVIQPDGKVRASSQGFDHVFPVFSAMGLAPDELFARYLQWSSVLVQGESHELFSGDAFSVLFLGNLALPSAAIVHRDVIERVGSFDAAVAAAEETEFFHRVAADSPLVVVMSRLARHRDGHPDRLISARNIEQLIRNAMLSMERARTLRRPLPPGARRTYAVGRERLLFELAYHELTELRTLQARATLLDARRQGVRLSPRLALLLLATFTPARALRFAHMLKTQRVEKMIRGSG